MANSTSAMILATSDHFFFFESALGHPGGAKADAGRIHRGFITRDGIAVQHDACHVQNPGSHIARKRGAVFAFDGFAIHVCQVSIRAAVGDAQSPGLKLVDQSCTVDDDLFLQFLKLVGLRKAEHGGKCRKNVHVRSALFSRKYTLVDLLGEGSIGGQNTGTARSGEGFVSGKGDDMRQSNG